MDQFGKCPNCGADWDNGDIFDNLRKQVFYVNTSDEELRKIVEDFYKPPYRFSRLVGLEFPGKYDGVWEWACPDCDARFPRFKEAKSGKV